jgi:hypothetical protein
MTREEIVSVRQRLLERRFQPIGIYNWDYPDIPAKERGKRPSEPGWQKTIGMPAYHDHSMNTGVLTGTVYPLDIDIEDPAIVTEVVTMADGSNAKLIATVHDELVVECRTPMVPETKERVVDAMTAAFTRLFPEAPVAGLVDAASGPSWGELE